MSFGVHGITDDGREASISWHEPGLARRGAPTNRRGLVGDEALVRLALLAETERDQVSATPTGPVFAVDLDDPVSTFVLLTSYFRDRYRVEGSPPVLHFPIPDGAVA